MQSTSDNVDRDGPTAGSTGAAVFPPAGWLTNRQTAERLQKDKQAYTLGYFDDEIAAAQAYDEKAIELYGDLARINFPNGVDAWLQAEHEQYAGDSSDGQPAVKHDRAAAA